MNNRQSFSPKARWDRNIPSADDYNPSEINECIEVLALFKGDKIYPQEFSWNNKQYKIERITYRWQEKEGLDTINYFSVNTSANLYQISFNNNTYGWRINKLIT